LSIIDCIGFYGCFTGMWIVIAFLLVAIIVIAAVPYK